MKTPLSSFPVWLKQSARVDVAQLWHGVRPVIRTELATEVDVATVTRWARRFGFFISSDADGFLSVSRDARLANHVLTLDRSPGNHTFSLGVQLGYPRCCCRKAAQVGDEGLDNWATTMTPDKFQGCFGMIDPSRYSDGQALISHLPCSPRCFYSLHMATTLTVQLAKSTGRLAISRPTIADWRLRYQPPAIQAA